MVGSEHDCHTRWLGSISRTLFACLRDYPG
jgi:hypothetical protein